MKQKIIRFIAIICCFCLLCSSLSAEPVKIEPILKENNAELIEIQLIAQSDVYFEHIKDSVSKNNIKIAGFFSSSSSNDEPYIKCYKCGYKETLNKRFVLKVIGGTVSGAGFWAWVTYFFAGTGLAMPICIALVIGGAGICAFSNEIAEWVSTRYNCPRCGTRNWRVVRE